MALGIYYLHCFDPPVLHLDLKSANVLLDELGTAKVLCPYVDLYLTSTRQPYYVPTLLRANLTVSCHVCVGREGVGLEEEYGWHAIQIRANLTLTFTWTSLVMAWLPLAPVTMASVTMASLTMSLPTMA